MKKDFWKKKISLTFIISLIAIILLIGIDQLTKYLAEHSETLLNGEKIMVIPHLISFVLVHNTGAAWGIFGGSKVFLVLMSSIAGILCLFIIYYFSEFKKSKLFAVSMILITAGALGNLIDRAFYSKGVIDFLNFEFMDFPVFNFADSCLTIGAIILGVYFLFFSDNKEKKPQEDDETVELVEEKDELEVNSDETTPDELNNEVKENDQE